MVKRVEEVKDTATGTRRKKPELGSNFFLPLNSGLTR
jgi:hypothetical protein